MSTWHPTTQSSEATDTRNGPDKDRSDSAEFWHRTPTEVEDTTPISTKTHHPPTPPPRTGTRHHQIASHMASTIWHTVEFSRNRRASPRDLSISSERLCRSESYLAFGPLPATRLGQHLRAWSPSPSGFRAHEAPGSTSGGGHPRDQPPWFDPRCPFLPLGRHREHYARVAAGGKSRRGDPRHQTGCRGRTRRSAAGNGTASPRGPGGRRGLAVARYAGDQALRRRPPRASACRGAGPPTGRAGGRPR